MDSLNFPDAVRWRLHLSAPPLAVFKALSTNEGRSSFWAESAVERDGRVNFEFPNGLRWVGRVLVRQPPGRFAVEYIGGSVATFEVLEDGSGGTDLTLTEEGLPADQMAESFAGWVSVLLALKAAVDFGVDLRNHDRRRTWDEGFVDN